MISVCMATYNGEKYIRQQVESILCQLGKEDEIVVSDDGSKDGTVQIIKSFQDSRIMVVRNEEEHGLIGNFENALRHANGDVIFLSDQDDVWKPDKVKVILKALHDADLVVHDAELIDAVGKSLGKNYYSCLHHSSNFLMNLWKTRFLGCCMAFNRRVLQDSLPFPKRIVGHDYWIGMFALTKYRVCFIPDILISYRRHGENVSSSAEASNESLCYKIIQKRLYMLFALMQRWLSAFKSNNRTERTCI